MKLFCLLIMTMLLGAGSTAGAVERKFKCHHQGNEHSPHTNPILKGFKEKWVCFPDPFDKGVYLHMVTENQSKDVSTVRVGTLDLRCTVERASDLPEGVYLGSKAFPRDHGGMWAFRDPKNAHDRLCLLSAFEFGEKFQAADAKITITLPTAR